MINLLRSRSGDRNLVLPARNLAYELEIPANVDLPLFMSVPTASKEGLRLVNIDGRVAKLIDSGGLPVALMPDALDAITSYFNISSIGGINTLHIHLDHIRNLETFIKTNQIPPKGIRFPSAFESPKGFGDRIRRLRTTTDPTLVKLGYGKGAATEFDVWDVAAVRVRGTNYFHRTYTEGDVIFDEYGLTRYFDKIAEDNTSGQDVDAGSTLLRITHKATKTRVLVVGDPRGRTIDELKTEMGEQRFGEMLEGVTIIEGVQHHTGTMNSEDVPGITRLFAEALMRNGELTVIDQSQLEKYGKQTAGFLNESFDGGGTSTWRRLSGRTKTG
jgi:hypothetical protein